MGSETTRKVMRLGDKDVPVVDQCVGPAVYADVYTEARVVGQMVYLSLGTVVLDGASGAEVHITSRIRLPIETAMNVQSAIQMAMQAAEKAAEEAKKSAN